MSKAPTLTAQNDVKKGSFVRKDSIFRNAISKSGKFPPAKGRYLLYVAFACPWASRCLAARLMKGLEDVIEVAVVSPPFGRTKPDVDEHVGWMFEPEYDEFCTKDPVFNAPHARAIYDEVIKALGEDIETRFTVPILFDKETKSIVNNESSEIMRYFNDEFNEFATKPEVNLYPEELIKEIDAMNDANYETINNGVYKCGFAQSQEAYDIAATALFDRLREVEAHLGTQRYLVGDRLTAADVRLFVTIVRFDEVYVVHFKCNKSTIRELPNLHGWMLDVYQNGNLKDSVNMKHIKEHYYLSHKSINTYQIIPQGPSVDLDGPHGRDTKQYSK